MWRTLVELSGKGRADKARLHPPATLKQMHAIEAALGVPVPKLLKDLLMETDGVTTQRGPFVWTSKKVVDENVRLRAEKKAEDLLCFASNQAGLPYAFQITNGEAHTNAIVLFDPATNTRTPVPGELDAFLDQWLQQQVPN
jgi:hypothetical protein